MDTPPTTRLYLLDDYAFEADARLLALRENALAFDRTCFYPGGGGQPPDEGSVSLPSGEALEIAAVYSDPQEVIWHVCKTPPPASALGGPVHLLLNKHRRLALMRYHTVLHVLNTLALRDYNAWITGVRIGADYSRIDFKLENFSAALVADLETKVNAVLAEARPLKSYTISADEFRARPGLLRTLEVQPPVSHGQVRLVEILGFDAQACGGTHVRTTAEVGRFSIFRTENKGRLNKRLYVRLDPLITPSTLTP